MHNTSLSSTGMVVDLLAVPDIIHARSCNMSHRHRSISIYYTYIHSNNE